MTQISVESSLRHTGLQKSVLDVEYLRVLTQTVKIATSSRIMGVRVSKWLRAGKKRTATLGDRRFQ
jgi:hypothetical protein